MEIVVSKDANELAGRFANFFAKRVQEKPMLRVALSGGRTPRTIFEKLVARFGDQLDWSKVKFFFGDERCVSPTDNQSNYRLANEHLFSKIEIPNENIYRIHGEDDPIEERKRYASILQSNLPIRNNVPQFDLILLGMGDDGHTASIFPNQLELWNSSRACEVAIHPDSGQKRVTITGDIINGAKEIAFLVTGKNKSRRIRDLIENPNEHHFLPAAKVAPTDGILRWFIDEAAASLLERV